MSMGGIYGLIQRNGAPVSSSALEAMHAAMQHWGPAGGAIWHSGPTGLGVLYSQPLPKHHTENFPQSPDSLLFAAAGRVDNRAELSAQLNFQPSTLNQPSTPDETLLLAAYQRWGDAAPERIYGDWSFAAWHPAERRLFLARDHFGNTGLYYYADAHTFAFASDRRALLALKLAPVQMDELYLAQVLVSWFAYHGERTIHSPIKRLPPAHTLSVTPERLELRQYWRLEDTPELRLPRREDYVEAFLEVFDEAVRGRLTWPESAGGDAPPVGVTLSGGLDSSSVAATAAGILRARGERLAAYTSVPCYDTRPFVGPRFGDEFPYAQTVAQFAGNIDHYPLRSEQITPLEGIRRMLAILNEPGHAAANFYWLLDLLQSARAQGSRVLLTGQMGNAGISWSGDPASHPLLIRLRLMGQRRRGARRFSWLKDQLHNSLPPALLGAYRRLRRGDARPFRGSAIHPEFARRLNLLERLHSDPDEKPARTPFEQRLRILQPGRQFTGAIYAELGAALGLEVRDPTANPRLLAFCLSVPDHIFIDPHSGMDRWLIRAAMAGRLPDEVRLNRKNGRQAGDLAPRLRASAAEVETALDELAHGPAAAYLDMPHMRAAWRLVQSEDTPVAFSKSITILTRGIMAGLWVNQFREEYG